MVTCAVAFRSGREARRVNIARIRKVKMVCVRSFCAIHPRKDMVEAVSALPYDVMNTEEARAMVEGKPWSFLRISRPEVEFDRSHDPAGDDVYARSRENLAKFIKEGVMEIDAEPQVYIYRQIMGDHVQTGVVACAHIDDYIENRIKKHEFTRKDKEDDRTRHVKETDAHTGPVFLAYRDDAAIDALVAADTKGATLYDFVTEDGIRHIVWRSSTPKAYEDAFEKVEACYIADGHHRAASAVRAGAECRAEAADPKADAPYCHFLAVFFPADQLKIMPYNRVLKDDKNRTDAEILDALSKVGKIEKTTLKTPECPGSYCIYLGKQWYLLTIDPATIDKDDPVASLDVDLLQKRVLSPIFDIQDPRTDKRIDFVGGIRGTEELERRVDSGEMRLAVSMYPTQIHQIFAVSDGGGVMPPKSTWFEPKLRSGLFVHSLH